MALVAAHDWPNEMDNRQQRPHANTAPVQVQHDPASQGSSSGGAVQQTPSPHTQPPYGYPHPQQPQWSMGNMGMNGMNMNMAQPGYFPQMQYYPQQYPHPQQQQPAVHQQGTPYGTPPPMFDPNAQFAQWAYQQMMFNAQQSQHQLSIAPGVPQQPQQQQRTRSGSHSGSNAGTPSGEFYQATFSHARYPSGTPPPPQNSTNSSYQGFHPYRRPDRGDRRPHTETSPSTSSSGNSVPFQPPYARADAAGSTSSINSTSSTSQRSRTNSGTSANGSVRQQHQHQHQHSQKHTSRQPLTSSSTSVPRSSQSMSSSSTASVSTLSTPSSAAPTPRTARPSPLSQGSTLSAAERRKSRDDSDIAAMLSTTSISGIENNSTPGPPMARSGLKGRLRRALSFNAAQTLREEEEEVEKINGKKKEKVKDGETDTDADGASMATKKTKKSLRMFNSRFNASTDNISLSSTVSSASVMIRKLGSMGRLARRNSLAGITSLFKDKDKDKDGDEFEAKGKKSKAKGSKAEASVSHVTAELERTNDWSVPGMEGLSPAAKLARQHTLKSNAEAAARAKAQQEAQAAVATASASQSGLGAAGSAPVPTWEQNTATRHGVGAGVVREDGMRVVVEEEDFEEEEENGMGMGMRQSEELDHGSGSDEDSTWHGHGHEEDEDVTIRMGGGSGVVDDTGSGLGHDEDGDSTDEPWAINIRRSIERARVPTRGILKIRVDADAALYAQNIEGPNPPYAQRVRANSYDSVPTHASEAAGPLARMPSPDPDHIDGLHRHGSHRSNGSPHVKDSATSGPPLLPPLTFDSPTAMTPSSALSSLPVTDGAGVRTSMFNHPGLNNSEPSLSTIVTSPPTLTHRAATTSSKRLAFATNLSVYDTFSANVYDRRSEPATWSRLTPALAQRIKEELNSYKMEEMEVHAASRVHTQFFV